MENLGFYQAKVDKNGEIINIPIAEKSVLEVIGIEPLRVEQFLSVVERELGIIIHQFDMEPLEVDPTHHGKSRYKATVSIVLSFK